MKLIFTTVMTGLVICLALAEGQRITNSNKTSYDAGYTEGSQKFMGQPMDYKELPDGYYETVDVVEDGPGIAVVKTIPPFASDKTRYFLVTGMGPAMMEKHHPFRMVGLK